jgi:hypothetical protein
VWERERDRERMSVSHVIVACYYKLCLRLFCILEKKRKIITRKRERERERERRHRTRKSEREREREREKTQNEKERK